MNKCTKMGFDGDTDGFLDEVLVHYLRHDVDPDVAGKVAAKEAFDGLGANILTIVTQYISPQCHAE